ncbi:MAG: TonB-dependent receptor [Pyrinomonadaceae bacterium]
MRVLTCFSTSASRFLMIAAVTMFFAASAMAQSQVAAADLTGTVTDPSGAVIAGATVHAANAATGISRTVSTDDGGTFRIISLPPGTYEVTAEAASFKKSVLSGIKLTVGQTASLTIALEVGETSAIVNVSADDIQLVETTKTNVSNTIDETRIDNLPINERSATGFALTISTVGRDNGRPVGPAPTSGLNIGGQRGRSTLVQVDGADFTDNSINAARSTVSQEAVQEYQVTTNSYMPEFGRATGGIVNVVTKRGTADFHGNVFGFIRHKSIQSRNAFAPIIDNDPSKKAPYTRAQYGATIGGPLNPGKTYFFISFEQRRRQESGFFTGNINLGDASGPATSSVFIDVIPGLNPFARTFTGLTPRQVAYVSGLVAAGTPAAVCTARAYAFLASTGTQTALNAFNTLTTPNDGSGCPAFSPILPSANPIGPRFLLSGAPVPLTRRSDGQYVAFRPLSQLSRIFPISEGTTYSSLRLDHTFTPNQQLSVRLGYNPSLISGIQDESQNQVLGQNDYSRTGIQDIEDFSFGSSLTSIFKNNLVNDLYYNYGRRVAKFDSQVPSVAHQIAGFGFIGSNPFSPVNRVETRHQIRDNVTWATGAHTFKFGGDLNWVSGKARFDLNFPALFNFAQQAGGSLVTGCDAASIPAAQRCPAFTPIQTYGLGFPSVFIEGFGDPNSTLSNKPVAVFAQDTWKIGRRFTLNFGVRYDYEFTEQFAPVPFTDPLTGITLTSADVQAAQDALNVTQGFPRDSNNIAPRIGFAWDVAGNGKTVIRGALGRFFDHPLLAVSFNSNIADGSQQQQATLLPIGGPDPRGLLNAFQVFHGTVCGVVGSNPTICGPFRTVAVAPSANYQFGFQRFDSATFTGFGPILPFTLNVAKDFQYPDAIQANFTIERMIGKNMSFSAGYILVNAHHLGHPQDVNPVNSAALNENFRRFFGVNPPNLSAAAFGISIPSSATDPRVTACPTGVPAPLCFTNMGATWAAIVPGFIAAPVANLSSRVISPIAANYFRTVGPNYFFVRALTGLNKPTFDTLLPGTLRSAGPLNAYADVNAQLSDGNSSYNAMNLELKKRFSTNMQFLASYTWSHSIDDSSDLQTLLKPQNNLNFRAERSDSLFDQRHRFVFSGVIGTPDSWRSSGGYRGFLHGFTFSPIVEFSSGRPFNILAVGDANGDFQSTNERPSVRADGTLCATGVDAGCFVGDFPRSGDLGRNMGITHNYFTFDARLTRNIRFGENISLDIIAEGFNLFNKFNEAAGNPFYQVVNSFGARSGGGKYYSQPTSSFDPRQFQFGLKLHF